MSKWRDHWKQAFPPPPARSGVSCACGAPLYTGETACPSCIGMYRNDEREELERMFPKSEYE